MYVCYVFSFDNTKQTESKHPIEMKRRSLTTIDVADRHEVNASFIAEKYKKRRISMVTRGLFLPNKAVDIPDESNPWRRGTLTAASLEASFSIVSFVAVCVASSANDLGFGF